MAKHMIEEHQALCQEVEEVQALVFASHYIRQRCNANRSDDNESDLAVADKLIDMAVTVLANCRTQVFEREQGVANG